MSEASVTIIPNAKTVPDPKTHNHAVIWTFKDKRQFAKLWVEKGEVRITTSDQAVFYPEDQAILIHDSLSADGEVVELYQVLRMKRETKES